VPKKKQQYVFMSFADVHTGKNIGCCIVEVADPNDATEHCKKLGLMPKTCNSARGFVLDEKGFKEQGMELNKFYSRDDMAKMGFQKETVRL